MIYLSCLTCLKPSEQIVCKNCQVDISICVHTKLDTERKIPGTSVPLYSFASYEGKVQRLIQIAKGPYLEQSALLDPWLHFAARRLAESLKDHQVDMVVPLPEKRSILDSRRKLARDLGFLVASYLQVPTFCEILVNDNNVKELLRKPQKEKNRWQRLHTAPVFKIRIHQKPLNKSRVLIVDDVCTTGGTMRAAIKTLEEEGFQVCASVSLADTPTMDFY